MFELLEGKTETEYGKPEETNRKQIINGINKLRYIKITLNINDLHTPIKKQKLTVDLKKKKTYLMISYL